MWLDKLRQKNKSVREQYAFVGAFLITGLIAGVWILSFRVNIDSFPSLPSPKADDTMVEEKTTDNFGRSAFGNFFSEAKSNFSDLISELSTSVEKITPEEEEKSFDAEAVLQKLKAEDISSSTNATTTGSLQNHFTTTNGSTSASSTGRVVQLEARSTASSTATTTPNEQ